MGKMTNTGLVSGPDQQPQESTDNFCSRRPDSYVADYCVQKQERGDWLSKEKYESVTGKPGRKD